MRSTQSRKNVRVHLFAAGISGISEPMPTTQAVSWAKVAVAAFPGLRFELIDKCAESSALRRTVPRRQAQANNN